MATRIAIFVSFLFWGIFISTFATNISTTTAIPTASTVDNTHQFPFPVCDYESKSTIINPIDLPCHMLGWEKQETKEIAIFQPSEYLVEVDACICENVKSSSTCYTNVLFAHDRHQEIVTEMPTELDCKVACLKIPANVTHVEPKFPESPCHWLEETHEALTGMRVWKSKIHFDVLKLTIHYEGHMLSSCTPGHPSCQLSETKMLYLMSKPELSCPLERKTVTALVQKSNWGGEISLVIPSMGIHTAFASPCTVEICGTPLVWSDTGLLVSTGTFATPLKKCHSETARHPAHRTVGNLLYGEWENKLELKYMRQGLCMLAKTEVQRFLSAGERIPLALIDMVTPPGAAHPVYTQQGNRLIRKICKIGRAEGWEFVCPGVWKSVGSTMVYFYLSNKGYGIKSADRPKCDKAEDGLFLPGGFMIQQESNTTKYKAVLTHLDQPVFIQQIHESELLDELDLNSDDVMLGTSDTKKAVRTEYHVDKRKISWFEEMKKVMVIVAVSLGSGLLAIIILSTMCLIIRNIPRRRNRQGQYQDQHVPLRVIY